MTLMDHYTQDPQFARLLAQEELILEVTETLCALLEKEEVSRAELAWRLGKSKGFVSQLLGGGRNLTLRTLADVLGALGYKLRLKAEKIQGQETGGTMVTCHQWQRPAVASPPMARVAREAELQDIYLLRASVSRLGPEAVQGQLVLEFDCAMRLLEEGKADHLLPVACDFSLAAREEEEPQREVMRVEATFVVSYEVAHPENLSMDDIHHFVRINPLYNAWSYWREFVHSMTIRMGLPPLLVPLLKIGPRKAPAPPAPEEKKRRTRRTRASS